MSAAFARARNSCAVPRGGRPHRLHERDQQGENNRGASPASRLAERGPKRAGRPVLGLPESGRRGHGRPARRRRPPAGRGHAPRPERARPRWPGGRRARRRHRRPRPARCAQEFGRFTDPVFCAEGLVNECLVGAAVAQACGDEVDRLGGGVLRDTYAKVSAVTVAHCGWSGDGTTAAIALIRRTGPGRRRRAGSSTP